MPDFEWPDLFKAAEAAHARRTDPSTSHAAADSVDRIRESQALILGILRAFGPMTDTEIAERIRPGVMSPSGCRTRRSELVTKGKVVDSGERKRLDSGRMSIVWRAI